MVIKKDIISQEGYEKLIREKTSLKEIQIPEIVEVLKDARSQGDLSENSDYHAAKDKLSLLKRRLGELEDILENVQIVDEEKIAKWSSSIQYWSKVVLSIEGDKEFTVEIVGWGEVHVGDSLAISLDSPLWKAIEGKKSWEHGEIKLLTGNKKISILSVS